MHAQNLEIVPYPVPQLIERWGSPLRWRVWDICFLKLVWVTGFFMRLGSFGRASNWEHGCQTRNRLLLIYQIEIEFILEPLWFTGVYLGYFNARSQVSYQLQPWPFSIQRWPPAMAHENVSESLCLPLPGSLVENIFESVGVAITLVKECVCLDVWFIICDYSTPDHPIKRRGCSYASIDSAQDLIRMLLIAYEEISKQ